MIIVCDTGPLLHLAEAGLLALFQKAGETYIPDMVDKEVRGLFAEWDKVKPDCIHPVSLSPLEVEESELLYLSNLLDYGEAEAIILAKRLKPVWFVTDDSEARIFANSLGMEAHGSLGIVLWSAAEGHLDYISAKEALIALSKTSLWLSPDVLSEAQDALQIMWGE